MINIPIRSNGDPMQVLATLFAKVFLWTHRLVQDPNAATVLPNFTHVALYEQASRVFRENFWNYNSRL